MTEGDKGTAGSLDPEFLMPSGKRAEQVHDLPSHEEGRKDNKKEAGLSSSGLNRSPLPPSEKLSLDVRKAQLLNVEAATRKPFHGGAEERCSSHFKISQIHFRVMMDAFGSNPSTVICV